jgi:hypothetical protein
MEFAGTNYIAVVVATACPSASPSTGNGGSVPGDDSRRAG